MTTSYDHLWNGTEPLGSARVVSHTSSSLTIRATDRTTKQGVLRFKRLASGMVALSTKEIWNSIHENGLLIQNLEDRHAIQLARIAEECGFSVHWQVQNLGSLEFFDFRGRPVPVPMEVHPSLLASMVAAGCDIDEVAVD